MALAGEGGSADLELRGHILANHVAPIRDTSGAVAEGIVLARAIVQHLPRGAVFLIDRDLRYVGADGRILNEMMQRTQLGTVVGRLVADIVSPANREAVLATYRAALAGKSQRAVAKALATERAPSASGRARPSSASRCRPSRGSRSRWAWPRSTPASPPPTPWPGADERLYEAKRAGRNRVVA